MELGHAADVMRRAASLCSVPPVGPEHLPTELLAQVAAELLKARTWIDAQLALLCVAADQQQASTGRDGRDLLGADGSLTTGQTKVLQRRGEVIRRFPALGQAHVSGLLSTAHLDAIVRADETLGAQSEVALRPHIAALIAKAGQVGADTYGRHVRNLVARLDDDEGVSRLRRQKERSCVRHWVGRDGMHRLEATLDPESGDKITTALLAEIKRLWKIGYGDDHPLAPIESPTYQQVAAAALVNVMTGTRPAAGPPEIVVVVDLDTLTSGLGIGSTHHTSLGTPLPPETLRRLACDARVIPAVLDGATQSLEVGRAARTVTPAQRALLRALYPTCGVEGCSVGFDFCQIHHIQHWTDGGLTDLDNLVPLCSRHHHHVHEDGWTLKLLPDRTLKVFGPDGRLEARGRPPGAEAVELRSTRHQCRPLRC